VNQFGKHNHDLLHHHLKAKKKRTLIIGLIQQRVTCYVALYWEKNERLGIWEDNIFFGLTMFIMWN